MSPDPAGRGPDPAAPGAERALLILGTGKFAQEVADLASEVPGVRLAGFVENTDRARCSGTLEGLPVFWVAEAGALAVGHSAVCAIGSPLRSRFTEQVAALGMPFATLVHPSARVSSRSSVGEGSIVSVHAAVGARTGVGRHVIVNRGALIGHHVEIGDHVTIGPGASVASSSRVGDGVYLGMGALVLDRVRIGAHAIVGAGAVVTRDVPEGVQVIGMPARVVKEAAAPP